MSAGAAISGLGVATPPGRLAQDAAAAFAEARCCRNDRERQWLRRIYRASTVDERASVLLGADGNGAPLDAFYPLPAGPEDRGPTTAERLARYAAEAGTLAARACETALQDGGMEPQAITHLVTVSCTGFFAPGIEIEPIERLGLAPGVTRLNVGFMGCHAAFNALAVAHSLVRSDPGARVLLCCIELCTLHFQYGWNRQKIVANALFADGAAAAVIASGGRAGLSFRGAASRIAPDSRAAMTWIIGDHGFEMGLSPEVPARIRGALRGWLADWLAGQGLGLHDIAHWAIHPGGPGIVQAVAECLELPPGADRPSLAVLGDHGNMSSATVLFILERLRRSGASGPCVALGFGPGLAFEAALFDF